jgi:hypothetical protein
MAGEPLTGPTTASHEGWTLQSSSRTNPTEAELKTALGVDPEAPVVPVVEPPAEPAAAVEAAPVVEEPEPVVEPVVAEVTPRPKRNDPQRRIDELTSQLTQERERNAAIEARLAALERPPVPEPVAAAPVAAAPVAAAPVVEKKPLPKWDGPDGYEAQGKSWEEFQIARDDYRDQQVAEMARTEAQRIATEHIAAAAKTTEEATQRARAEAARTQVLTANETRIVAARAKYQDFDQVLEQNMEDFKVPYFNHLVLHHPSDGAELLYHVAHHPELKAALAKIEPTRAMVDALQRSRNLVPLVTYLAQHPAEADALQRNPDPISVLIEIGRLDALRGTSAPAASPVPARVSQAAPPVRAVSGAPVATITTPKKDDVDDLEFGPEFVKRANARDALQRRSGRPW